MMRKCQLNVRAQETREHELALGQDFMQVHGLRVEDLLAAEGQKLAGDGGGSMGGALKLFEVGPAFGFGRQRALQQFGGTREHHQHVVEVVGNSSR